MRKLIQKTVLFMLPILLVLGGIELFYRIVPNTFTIKNEAVKRCFDTSEVLILGNSHTFYGLNPKYFSTPCYNLANISQTLYFDELLIDTYYLKMKKLEYLILNVDYETLSELDNGDEDVWRKYFYKSYMNLEVPIISAYDPKTYFLSATRNFNDNFQIIKRYVNEGTIVDCDKNGFGVNYLKKNRLPNIEKLAPFAISRHEDFSMDFAHNCARIQAIADKCKSKNIKVILVTMPMTTFYAQGINQEKLTKIETSCLFLKQANKNVYYLNLLQDSRFTNDDFYDADHLHNEGATKCSVIVNDFISKI